MIQKIIEHKTRNGILAFFGGLILVVVALYMDVFRGDTSGTIGMYQIAGSLTGYIISAVGTVLVMKETAVRKALQNILIYGGTIVITISVFADHLGVAGPSGFDKFQTVGAIIGLIVVTFGLLILLQRSFPPQK